jgi:hypothetical protein
MITERMKEDRLTWAQAASLVLHEEVPEPLPWVSVTLGLWGGMAKNESGVAPLSEQSYALELHQVAEPGEREVYLGLFQTANAISATHTRDEFRKIRDETQ